MVPCCDDTMFFNGNLVSETFEFVKVLHLSPEDIKEKMMEGVNAIFDEEAKEGLRERIEKY